MKKLWQFFVIFIYLFFIFCGTLYLWPEIWQKVDEKVGYDISSTLKYKIDLAIEKIQGLKSSFDNSIDESAPNTANRLEDKIDTIENAN